MGVGLGTYMLLGRLFQAGCCAIILSSNGWLMDFIIKGRLGLGTNMVVLEVMAGIIIFFTATAIVVLHMCHKSTRRRYLVTFIVWDTLSIGVCIAMISIFSFAGVPNNCGGMTRLNYGPNDAPNNPAPSFTTIRFGPGTFGNYGQLDMYCSIPIANYSFCVVLVFTYVITIVLAILRILSSRFTSNSSVTKLVEEAREEGKGASSISTAGSSIDHTNLPRVHSPIPPIQPTVSSPPASQISPFNPAEETDVADPRISNGSRGDGDRGSRFDPPPYVPGLGAGRMRFNTDECNVTRSGEYSKDQSFPGVNGIFR